MVVLIPGRARDLPPSTASRLAVGLLSLTVCGYWVLFLQVCPICYHGIHRDNLIFNDR
jgi:hypothetical protein